MSLLEILIRKLIQLPNFVWEFIFILVYPIYAILHTDRAYGRVLVLLRKAGFSKKQVSVRSVFYHLFFNMIDSLRYLSDAKNKPEIQIENEALLKEALQKNIPLVFVGIHSGAFEILHRTLCKYTSRVHLFTSEMHSKKLTKAIRNIRSTKGLREHNTTEIATVFRQFIKEKSVLSLAIDQSKAKKGNKTILFHRPFTLFLRLPLKANQTGAGIITFRIFRISKTEHILRFEHFYKPYTDKKNLILEITEETETWIQEHPEEWTWNYHRNWNNA